MVSSPNISAGSTSNTYPHDNFLNQARLCKLGACLQVLCEMRKPSVWTKAMANLDRKVQMSNIAAASGGFWSISTRNSASS
jgi:hypothetical protein